jgi:hypothetical protein
MRPFWLMSLLLISALAAQACGDDGPAPVGADTLGTPDSAGDTQNGANHPPELERIGDRTVAVNKTLSIALSAKDADNDPLTFSVFGNLPEGARFDKVDHRFEWSPKTAGQTLFLTFVVSDGTDFDRETVRIQVTENETANPPSFVEVGDQIVPVDQPYTLQLAATDPDGDALTFGHDGTLPEGASLDSRAGLFTWRPGRDAVGAPVRVTFTVSDGTGTDEMPVRFVVDDGSASVPKPPVFPPIPTQTARVGAPLSVKLVATDPNGDAITYALVSGSPAGGVVAGDTYNYTAAEGDVGKTFEVTFSATDGTFTAVAKMKMSVTSGGSATCATDAAEPNENPSQAKPLASGTVTASLCETASTYDVDVYAVTIPAGQEFRATLRFTTANADLDLALVDANEFFLASSEGIGGEETVRYQSLDGIEAFLVVTGYALEPLAVTYTLETSLGAAAGCQDDRWEDNDVPSDAWPVDDDVQSAALQICASDADFWFFEVACGQRVEVLMDILGAADLDLYLYDDADALNEPVDAAITEDSTEYIDHLAAQAPGLWQLEVSGYPFATAESAYNLIVDVTGGCTDDGQNSSRGAARNLDRNGAPLSNLSICCTEDWYALNLSAGDSVLVDLTVTGGNAARAAGLVALGPNGTTQLASKPPSTDGGLIAFSATTSGTHYLRVSGAVGTRYGLEWQVEAGGSGCTLMSCARYEVCDASSRSCIADFCTDDADCPASYACRETYCVNTCTQASDCRAGYACKGFPDGNFCGVAGSGQTGASCADHASCASNYGCLFTNRSGYCAERGCSSCDVGTKCATVNGVSFCAKTCNSAADCRTSDGFTCSAEKTCLPQNP